MRQGLSDQRPRTRTSTPTVVPTRIGASAGCSSTHPIRNISQRRRAAHARSNAAAPTPTPTAPSPAPVPAFVGAPATPRPVPAPAIPQHPFMAPNGRSNIHADAYQTDTYVGGGPLGRNPEVLSTQQNAECGSLTFDSAGRIVTICV